MGPQTDPSTFIGKPCSSNPEDEKVKELGHRKGWQQCPGCGNMTCRNGGCPHIKCTVCGVDWCYYCGRKDCDTQRCQRERNMYLFHHWGKGVIQVSRGVLEISYWLLHFDRRTLHLEWEIEKVVALANRKEWKSYRGCENLLSKTFKTVCAACDNWSCDICSEENLKHWCRCYLASKRRQLQQDEVMLAYPLLCLQWRNHILEYQCNLKSHICQCAQCATIGPVSR